MLRAIFLLAISLTVVSTKEETKVVSSTQKSAEKPPIFEAIKTPVCYNYFQISLQWAPSVCATRRCHEPFLEPDRWTINGLLPTSSPPFPNTCYDRNLGCRVNFTELAEASPKLVDDMWYYWPSLYNKATPEFWKYIYCKYGTCYPEPGTDYFKKAISMAKKVNELLKDVTDRGPGAFKQMNKALGVNVGYWCRNVRGGAQIIEQIGVCYDRDWNMMDCPHAKMCAITAEYTDYCSA